MIILSLALAGLFVISISLLVCWIRAKGIAVKERENAEAFRTAGEQFHRQLTADLKQSREENARLAKWTVVADAEDHARKMIAAARQHVAQAEADARILTANAERQYMEAVEKTKADTASLHAEARAKAKEASEDAQAKLRAAAARAEQIIVDANQRAAEIAGEAIEAVRDATKYEKIARAMKNIIEGYGDAYLIPAESLLDELADDFSHKEAGQRLKLAREHTKAMIKNSDASACEYVEASRREGAERFVLDAFNGKVDSILSRVRHDNVGTLSQEIVDAFTVVNHGGSAFKNARITDEYLAARLEELRWGAIAQELKREEQEEQRRIREQMRDEEKARKEFERAIKEAAKEEELLRKAMVKAQSQLAVATEEQRAKYEAQLAELNARLQSAEEKNIRAISMAQQTRRGHVYIISNIGSFGENVYKIGLTRRLDPLDRIWELGDSSVPFDFDVHALILSEDAPALERQLHKHFVMMQINKVNHRKEFFRAPIIEIKQEIERLGIEAKWTMAAEAAEYRETVAIERMIAADPAACEAWRNRQLTLDPVTPVSEELLIEQGRESVVEAVV